MFIYSNYLFGILIVIGYWVYFVNARPPIQNISKSEEYVNASKQSLTKGLTRILSHSSGGGASREPSIEIEDEDYTDTQDIIFPDSYEEITEKEYSMNNTPKCAEDATFCENVESYPYQQLKELLKRGDVPKIFFGVDEVPDQIANRIGEPEEKFLCGSVEKTIYPQIGKTKNQKWKYIVNQGESGYEQGVRIELCSKPNGPCDLINNVLPNGYVASCKQKYVYRRLLSISDEGKHTVKETFQIPSACCCAYKKNVHFLSTFGTQ